MIMLIWWWWWWWFFHSKIGPHLLYPGFHRLFMRGFRFRLSIKKWATRKVFSKSFFSRLRHSCLRPKTCRPAADEAPHHTREKTSVTQGTPSHKWPLSHSSLFVGRCVDLGTSRAQLFSRALSASGRFFVLCGKSERESERARARLVSPARNRIKWRHFGANYLRPCHMCRRELSKYVRTNK